MLKSKITLHYILILILCTIRTLNVLANNEPKYLITSESSFKVDNETWTIAPGPGDTIFIASDRTESLWFDSLIGAEDNPITVINYGGQVHINSTGLYAIKFLDCNHIKISGAGDPGVMYGIKLSSTSTGLQFGELSSDCEAEFIEIDHDGFFGIVAKKDYSGDPPNPIPVFDGLRIHDCFVKNVTEGMYLGETKSPGMEFKHVEIYNNIVYNTGRESIQIANMVEDVKIYNNTLISAGNDSIHSQGNILQIGDNSVAEVFNNIMIGGYAYGIISFGNGNNQYYNNYLAGCKGMFIDNRLFSDTTATIEISDNNFYYTINTNIIKNLNEINDLNITDNLYNTNATFFVNGSGNESNYYLTNNNLADIEQLSMNNIIDEENEDPTIYDDVIEYITNFYAEATEAINNANNVKYVVNNESSYIITNKTWAVAPGPGDTIFVSSDRNRAIWFEDLNGAEDNPITIINDGGQVNINTESSYAMKFLNCTHIKISGTGDPSSHYGFKLNTSGTGLEFTKLCSDIETEFTKIETDAYFGIVAKQNYYGNPPSPIPVFDGLSIHDCYLKNMSVGMYLGEAKSPGMEFKNVEIYNNVVYNTTSKAIQISNMTENAKIYNNILLNEDNYGENLIRIYDNSVADVYSNILVGSYSYGIYSYGNGNNKLYNNYIAENSGIYINNLSYSDTTATIVVNANYFYNTNNSYVIKNYNEINNLIIADNIYNTDVTFFQNSSGNDNNYTLDNNILKQLDELPLDDIDNLRDEDPAINEDLWEYISDFYTESIDTSSFELKSYSLLPDTTTQKSASTSSIPLRPNDTFSINTYPNPSNGEFILITETTEYDYLYAKIFNLSGKLILFKILNTQDSNCFSFNLTEQNIKSGIYFLVLTDNLGNNTTTKLVIQP